LTAVFLSYAHEDDARVRPIKLALDDRGHHVFWDHDISVGENWRTTLSRRMQGAQCVLVAWSRASVESEYVRLEARLARERGCFVPLLLEDVRPPPEFESIQAINLCGWTGNMLDPRWESVVAEVESRGSSIGQASGGTVVGFEHDPTPSPKGEGSGRGDAKELGASRFQKLAELEIRTALCLAPVQRDALRDITSIRTYSDQEFSKQLRDLERQRYVVVRRRPGEALLERDRTFNWVVAAILTVFLVFPLLIYVFAFLFLPKAERIYVLRVK
jgi:hypothetical protein